MAEQSTANGNGMDLNSVLTALTAQVQLLNTQLTNQQAALTLATQQLQAQQLKTLQLEERELKRLDSSLSNVHVAKPEMFQGTVEHWSDFKWSFQTWIGSVDVTLPTLMKDAAKSATPLEFEDMDFTTQRKAAYLFAVLASYAKKGSAMGIAKSTPGENGFELWRRLAIEYEPAIRSKQSDWLNTLIDPSFPKKEQDFCAALHE
jgi:hypothetical protein